jgi:two-component system sensor histidine kinase MtrB
VAPAQHPTVAQARLRAVNRARRFMRIGLRSRITIAFGFGALALSVLLALVTFGLVRENLVNQREKAATNQAFFNASIVRDQLRSESQPERDVLEGLESPSGASPVLLHDGQWFGVSVERGREQLPLSLRETVAGGAAARMRFRLSGHAQLGVGVPIPGVKAAYFEIASFDDTEKALSSLGFALVAAAVVTTVAGAFLGAWASRRVLRPLGHVSAAAVAIAGGRLDTRVAPLDDPDLGTLVNSFNDMASALQERIERDARFASDVSHELRSPLTTLTTSISILESRRDELPERPQQALDLLVADVARFSQMVEDLLEISRFDAGAAQLHLESVRISELVLQAVAASTEVDIPVAISADAAACMAMVDKRRLVRVIANLITNADRYGGGATRVDVALADNDVRIAVEDEGPGVDEADRDRIFERFARGTDAAGRRGSGEGVGLGLALVKEHINLHGGRVWVEDGTAGTGARFVFELPTVAPDPAEEEVLEDLGPAAVLATDLAEEEAAAAAEVAQAEAAAAEGAFE